MRRNDNTDSYGLDNAFHMAVRREVVGQRFRIILHDRSFGFFDMAVGRIDHPVQTDSRIFVIIGQKSVDVPVLFQNDKLVYIDVCDPVGPVVHTEKAMRIGFYLRGIGYRTVDNQYDSFPDIRFEGLFGRDHAVVVVQDEMLDPDAEVMLRPFDQIGRFVFQDGADDNMVFLFEWDCLYTLNITIKY